MTTAFKVQHGVPLPEVSRAPVTPRRKYPLADMTVDSMFFVPGRSCKSLSAYVSRIAKNLPGRYAARHVWMWQDQRDGTWRRAKPGDSGAVEGTGVWRVA